LSGDESQDMVLPQTRLAALEAREDYAGSEVTARLLCCNQYMKQNEGRGNSGFPLSSEFRADVPQICLLRIDLQGEKRLN
jgi:hypothetical protein